MQWIGTSSPMDVVFELVDDVRRTLTPRFIPDLVDVEQDLFELPRKVCIHVVLIDMSESFVCNRNV